MEHISLGSSPYEETPVQLGTDDFTVRSHAELRAYRNQLQRLYKAAHNGDVCPAVLRIVAERHDFGTYYELNVYFDRDTADAAYWLEENLPAKWDPEAVQELAAYLFAPPNQG